MLQITTPVHAVITKSTHWETNKTQINKDKISASELTLLGKILFTSSGRKETIKKRRRELLSEVSVADIAIS